MIERLDREIDIQIRPVQMVWTRKGDVRDLRDGRVTKPREVIEANEALLSADDQ